MIDELYENIGKKLKNWAKGVFIIEAITAIIFGIRLITNEEIGYGLICVIAGPFVALISTWLLYAFGELVEKTAENERHTRNIWKSIQDLERPASGHSQANVIVQTPTGQKPKTDRTQTTFNTKVPQAAHSWRCENCGRMTSQSPCEHCGA